MRALKEDNARLESKILRLEQQQGVGRVDAPRNISSASAPERHDAMTTLPPLTVVKLKPKKETAPALNTDVEVFEPSLDVVAAIKKIEAEQKGIPSEQEVDPVEGEQVFEKSLSALKTGNVIGAVEQLKQFAQAYPTHAKADNALYFSGVGSMGLDRFEEASATFEAVVHRYPAGDAVQDSMLKLAECRLKLNKPQEAKAVYERVVSRFPGTAAATLAQRRLAHLR
jgi:tol-pal system protein YbgF